MIDSNNVPEVADNELLARFILDRDEKRADGTVKPKLFLPYKWIELSVNRHRQATIEETWQVGFDVAVKRNKQLQGLANIRASSCCEIGLKVVPDALPGNPNHANVVGYPEAKEDQMSFAQQLAASIDGKWQKPPAES